MTDASQRDRQEFGTDLTEVRHEPLASPWRLRLYVAAVTLFPFALIVFTFWWVTTGSYLRHVPFPYIVDTGYGSRLHNADCDIVIDGDSTALVGVLPRIIEQRTGLKTCNIAEVAGIKLVSGMMVLDDYLAHNRRPKYLVFVFAPENLNNPAGWIYVNAWEGWFYRIRFHPDRAFWRMTFQSPDNSFANAELAFRNGMEWLSKRPLPPALAHERNLNGGHVGEPAVSRAHCVPGDAVIRHPDPVWLESLRHTYGVGGTRVLIDATPMPACDEGLPFYRSALPGLIDNTLDPLPVGDYNISGRLHTNDRGTIDLSQRIADQLVTTINSQSDKKSDHPESKSGVISTGVSAGDGVERPLYFSTQAVRTAPSR